MKESLIWNWKEQKRLMVLNQVETGNVAVRESARGWGFQMEGNDLAAQSVFEF